LQKLLGLHQKILYQRRIVGELVIPLVIHKDMLLELAVP
jgi:hypothetical protein